MTPRSIRRAAERKARKAMERKARLAAQRQDKNETHHEEEAATHAEPDFFETASELELPNLDFLAAKTEETPEAELAPESAAAPKPHAAISQARLAANRANAQLSTGPTSQTGRDKAALNAVKTGVTGRTVLLPSDDAALYEQHVLAYSKELRPITQRECDLVQSIADTAWRLKRIPALEMAVFAQGRIEFAESFENHEPAARPSMIELKTFLTYEKQLRNLQLQEARLHRRYEKDTAELRNIQAERKQREKVDIAAASKLYLTAKHDRKPFHPSDFGFEFSIEDIEEYLEGVRAAQIAREALKHGGKAHRQAA